MTGKTSIIIGTMFVILSLVGCKSEKSETGKAVSTTQKEKTQVEKTYKPAYGDMLITGSIADASVLLPFLNNDSASNEIVGAIFNGLVKYNKDIKLVPDLAEKWEISDDKKTIRFHLRKDVKWQDGEPFTTRDIEYTYKVVIDKNTPTSYASDFLMIKEFHKLDKYTFEVTYENPYAPALGSWGQGMLPAHLLDGKDITKSPLKRHPIGTGPYKFKEWTAGEKIVLDANSNYFDGKPYIARRLTRIIPDPATMFLELKAGKIDYMGLDPIQYQRQTNTKRFKQDFRKYKYLSFGYTYLGYNLKDWRFKDKMVRQALTTAIDRKGIIKGVLLGLGEIIDAPYKPDTYWYNHNVKTYPYDPEKAKQMLAEAGWKDTDGDGILEKDGKPFEFTILTNQGNKSREKAATIIQQNLKRVGIKVDIRVIEWAAFLKNFINKRKFDAVLLGWSIGIDPDQKDIWLSTKIGEHELNFISYNNPRVDELLGEKAVKTYDRAERKKYYDEFQAIIAEDQPYTFLYAPYSLPIISARIKGIKPAPIGIGYNFDKWYVPKPLQKYRIQQ